MFQGTGMTKRSGVFAALAAAGIIGTVPAAHAFELTEPDSEIKVNWDNTVRYRVAARTGSQNTNLFRPNFDDGNRNFDKGIVSNKLELLTELDAQSRTGNFGARVSALGWYDTVLNTNNDNPGFQGGAFPNQTSTNYNQFTKVTRDKEGRDVELRDAFVFAKFDADKMPVTVRLGQHAMVWGESLFFAGNAIAGGQSPFDFTRLMADPTAQAKDFVLPVPQISGQIQVTPDVTVGAYYQFKWVRNRIPAVGSYFSYTDIIGAGAERMLVFPMGGPGTDQWYSASAYPDMTPENSGQGGLQLRWNALETDFGLYAIRFHDKSPTLVTKLGAPFGPPQFGAPVLPTGFYQAYNEGTNAYGFSASHTFGDANFAFESSIRHNQQLASSLAYDATALVPPFIPVAAYNNSSNPAYAVGKTAHANASVIWSLEPGVLWREAVFVGEVAWNRMLSCDKSCGSLDPNGTRDAWGMRAVFTPTYRQALPGLDLSVPIGVGYAPNGSRPLAVGSPAGWIPQGGGDLTIGLTGVYEQKWNLNLSYVHYYGTADTFLDGKQTPTFTWGQTLRDRDFVSFTVRTTF